MSEVTEITGENSFKSQQDIAEFNKRHFPREAEKTTVLTVGHEDPMASLRSQMKQRVYTFSASAKESSSMKVAEFRSQLQDIKAKVGETKTRSHPEAEQSNYATLRRNLYNGADLISNIGGSGV